MRRFNCNYVEQFVGAYNNNVSDSMAILVRYINKDNYSKLFRTTFDIIIGETSHNNNNNVPTGSNYKIYDEIELGGVVIGGEKLRELIRELHARPCLLVNCEGVCMVFSGDRLGTDRTCYPLYELFDWSKYGVFVKDQTLSEEYYGEGEGAQGFPRFDRYYNFSSYVSFFGNGDDVVDESQVIRLDAHDVFLSCKDGPILVWRVDEPVREIRNVRLTGVIDRLDSEGKAKIDINGVTLKGGKLVALRDELFGRQVMVNFDGWCLYYTITKLGERDVYHYYRISHRFNWKEYGVSTVYGNSLWRPRTYLNEEEAITQC